MFEWFYKRVAKFVPVPEPLPLDPRLIADNLDITDLGDAMVKKLIDHPVRLQLLINYIVDQIDLDDVSDKLDMGELADKVDMTVLADKVADRVIDALVTRLNRR